MWKSSNDYDGDIWWQKITYCAKNELQVTVRKLLSLLNLFKWNFTHVKSIIYHNLVYGIFKAMPQIKIGSQ